MTKEEYGKIVQQQIEKLEKRIKDETLEAKENFQKKSNEVIQIITKDPDNKGLRKLRDEMLEAQTELSVLETIKKWIEEMKPLLNSNIETF